MKYIKNFDSKLHEVQIGEYVILDLSMSNYKSDFYDFIESHIGQFIESEYYNAIIKYDNIPEHLKNDFKDKNIIQCDISFIDKHSFDKNELESVLASKKYNL